MIVIAWLSFAVVCAIIASHKNRSACAWFFLGLIFAAFALIVLVCIPAEKQGTHRKCPHCAEDVLVEAKICKHCNKELGAIEKPANNNSDDAFVRTFGEFTIVVQDNIVAFVKKWKQMSPAANAESLLMMMQFEIDQKCAGLSDEKKQEIKTAILHELNK